MPRALKPNVGLYYVEFIFILQPRKNILAAVPRKTCIQIYLLCLSLLLFEIESRQEKVICVHTISLVTIGLVESGSPF